MNEIICSHCKNPIYDEDALLCHFCGESLNHSSSGTLGWLRGTLKWLVMGVVIIIILSFLLSHS